MCQKQKQKGSKGAPASGSPPGEVSKLELVQSLLQELTVTPDLILQPELEFFKQFVQDFKIPLPEKEKPEHHEEEPSDEEREEAEQFKTEAREAQNKGELARALALFTKAVNLYPTSTLILADRAQCYIKFKMPSNAVKDCDRAIAINPDSGKAFRIRGNARYALKQYEKAYEDLCVANRIDYDPEVAELIKKLQERFEEEKKSTSKRTRRN